jgi:S1-C subfamily serine protease
MTRAGRGAARHAAGAHRRHVVLPAVGVPHLLGMLLLAALALAAALAHAAGRPDVVARVKQSVVAVGTYEAARSPQFKFLGTGFAVGDGSVIVTNAHVLPPALDGARKETVAVLSPAGKHNGREQAQWRQARTLAVDDDTDLALLKVDGPPLPALTLKDSDAVREGDDVFMTGFPIGAVLGPYPATHRGLIASITPIAIPQRRAADLDAPTLRRLSSGTFPVFQLDATAYPGNSGSPIYDPDTGEVVGIVNMVLVKGTKESVLKDPTGITYAIPARHLQALLQRARGKP